MSARSDAVTFLVPVKNGGPLLERVLESLLAEAAPLGARVLVVDDGSTDDSWARVERFRSRGVEQVRGPGRGAAAALNAGFRLAETPRVAQVDQDVVLLPGWVATLQDALGRHPGAAAAQGYYQRGGRGVWARVMGLDLEARYARLPQGPVDHVCTGNTLYRREAVLAVGGFDESLGYGYDNDLSYRLAQAGHTLWFCPTARSIHHWRESLWGYLRQQYGVGYGRLDVISKHPGRVTGDRVSGLRMILHVPLMAAALAALAGGVGAWALGGTPTRWLWVAGGCLVPALLERMEAGGRAAVHFREPMGMLFPVVHLLRDAAWVWASAVWGARRLTRRPRLPSDSMGAWPP